VHVAVLRISQEFLQNVRFSFYQQSPSRTTFVVVFRFLVLVAYENLAEFYHLTAEPAQTFLPDSEELE
jgi:hypothetical protein